jgi:polyisoprenoid-binding protein YceI
VKIPQQINRDELNTLIRSQDSSVLIDVLPAEYYEDAHLPGAKNACVYEVTFLDQVGQLAADKECVIVVYGSGPRNLASATAAEKLLHAGYRNVFHYRGGLEDWMAAGFGVEGNRRAKDDEKRLDGSYTIDCEQSRVEWTGRNLTGSHTGTIKLLNGTIAVANDRATHGAFTIDMRSIEDADIADLSMRGLLISHLKSDDFFDVDHFPTAEFRLSAIRPIEGVTPGSPNSEVSGELTMKGVTRELTFPAVIGPAADGRIAAEAHFDIDRTKWNVLYGSGKFYEKLGKHLVHDNVTVGLKLIAAHH